MEQAEERSLAAQGQAIYTHDHNGGYRQQWYPQRSREMAQAPQTPLSPVAGSDPEGSQPVG